MGKANENLVLAMVASAAQGRYFGPPLLDDSRSSVRTVQQKLITLEASVLRPAKHQ